MKSRLLFVLVVLVGLGSWTWYWQWEKDAPRRAGFAALENLYSRLQSPQPGGFEGILVMPQTLRNRTAAEQIEFNVKALRDEVSAEGIAFLRIHGQFGALTNIFPAEAQTWASQAGVKAEDCLAFRLDRSNGLRAEVVLAKISLPDSQPPAGLSGYHIVRCNNVKQLAVPNIFSTNSQP